MSTSWLIVGLGNPGKSYSFNRHNIGFLAIDHFLKKNNSLPPGKSEHQALTAKLRNSDAELIFAQPQTFMNLSGSATQKLMHYYKIAPENLIVIHDEIDQKFGIMKIQKARGHGGHNGIRDIHQKISTNDYIRIRLGVGRPTDLNPRSKQSVADFVLNDFSSSEKSELEDFFNQCAEALESITTKGYERSANIFNTKQK